MREVCSVDSRAMSWDAFSKRFNLNLNVDACRNNIGLKPELLLDMNEADVKEAAADTFTTDLERTNFLAAVKAYVGLKGVISFENFSRKLKIVLIGRTNVGKTSFINVCTDARARVSVEGRTTQDIQTYHGTFVGKKEVYEFSLVDTPGVDDGEERDKRTYVGLEKLLTQLADIDAVVLVVNGESPVLDAAIVKAIEKYGEIFGDAFKQNFGILFTRWYEGPSNNERRRRQGRSEEVVTSSTWKTLKEAGLPNEPVGYHFIDSDPLGPAEQKCTEDRLEKFFAWATSLTQIQTKTFSTMSGAEMTHLRAVADLAHLWDAEFEMSQDGDDLLLTKCDSRVVLSALSVVFAFGIPGRFYEVNTVKLIGIPGELWKRKTTREAVKDGSNKGNLKGLLAKLEGFNPNVKYLVGHYEKLDVTYRRERMEGFLGETVAKKKVFEYIFRMSRFDKLHI